MPRQLAIVGATGAVGREMIRLLEPRESLAREVCLYASPRSAGARLEFRGRAVEVCPLDDDALAGVDLALFAADKDTVKMYVPRAVEAGAVVIDNSSTYRMDPAVPLVVPEVNPQHLRRHRGLIANPNCSAILLAVVLWPLHRAHPIRRVVVSTYQAASGAGMPAMEELHDQTRVVLAGDRAEPRAFPHQIAFNLFSHDSPIGPEGYNEEELKIRDELRKLFDEPELRLSATCVRVPVMRAHSEAVNVTFESPIDEAAVREILAAAPGVRLVDDRAANRFPMPLDASGRDEVLVGRIRADISRSDGRGIALFLSGDQLRKGAALNAIQIAEMVDG